ncbi:AI-2E family transporter [Alloiococcus sp. CFN-8]|uniref:AI-2E family transporter n=1 Tax=Alloiococcus sp. CFN-8 TaxID=3416081 RepID=UPI003CE8CAA0
MELDKHNIKRILFIICFSIFLYWMLNHFYIVNRIFKGVISVISPFLIGLCFAFVINVLLRPIEEIWDKLSRKGKTRILTKIKRPICLLTSILIIFGVIFILLFIVVPEIQRTVSTIVDTLPQYMSNLEAWWDELNTSLEEAETFIPQSELSISELGTMASDYLSERGESFFNKTVDLTTSIFSAIFNVILGVVFALYVLSQKEKLGSNIKKLLLAFLPADKVAKMVETSDLTNKIFTNFVTGQLMESVIIGVLCFIGMLILGIPYAPMISVLVGFTALIPVFGAFIGTAVGALLIVMEDPLKALWFILFIIILQQLEGDIIYPKVVGKSVGLPSMWVLIAVTIGGSTFGVLGMLLSVPVCSVIYSISKQIVNHKLNKKGISPLED